MLDTLSDREVRLVLPPPVSSTEVLSIEKIKPGKRKIGRAGNPSADVADVKYAFGIEINI